MPTETERSIITSHLHDYGDDEHFIPLWARSYGSRSRGTESESSDYDVMFIYTKSPIEHAIGRATESYSKTISPSLTDLDTEVELHGWSLSKFIGSDGLAGSNPTAVEFCYSPAQYFMRQDVKDRLLAMAEVASDYKPYALIQHYRSLAASNYGKYIVGDYRLVDGASYDDMLDYANIDWHYVGEESIEQVEINDLKTEIGEETVNIWGEVDYTFGAGEIDTETLEDDGIIKPTTLDRTVKRYLNICRALCMARHIESTQLSTVEFPAVLSQLEMDDTIDTDVADSIWSLIEKKICDKGSDNYHDSTLNEWIESELNRDIAPAGLVERQPDCDELNRLAVGIYNDLYWNNAV